MKVFRFGLHLWIAFASVLSFLGGWILLAHSPKPVEAAPAASNGTALPMPTLAPLPPLNFESQSGGSALQVPPIAIQAPRPAAPVPVFRTAGS